MKMNVYQQILKKKKQGKKQFAILIDPGKKAKQPVGDLAKAAEACGADYFFVGGSLLTSDSLERCIREIKDNSAIPVVIFPGSVMQISKQADAILFLSVISGRNPEMLIGRHVISAPILKASSIEVISTGYMLVESGRPTAVSYMSDTTPIPSDKVDIAACTAMAGELLGMKVIFMDAGSGAQNPVSKEMIHAVRSGMDLPLITGGGIRTVAKAIENCKAGADVVVVGNSIEDQPSLLGKIAKAIRAF